MELIFWLSRARSCLMKATQSNGFSELLFFKDDLPRSPNID